jgi:hypothetical protein
MKATPQMGLHCPLKCTRAYLLGTTQLHTKKNEKAGVVEARQSTVKTKLQAGRDSSFSQETTTKPSQTKIRTKTLRAGALVLYKVHLRQMMNDDRVQIHCESVWDSLWRHNSQPHKNMRNQTHTMIQAT